MHGSCGPPGCRASPVGILRKVETASRGQQVEGRACHGFVYRNEWCGAMGACGQAPPWSPGGGSICRLDRSVVDDQVVVGSLVVRGVLRSLCV